MCPYRNCCKLLSIRRWHRLQDIINIKRRWRRSWRLSLTPSSSFRSASTCCTLGGDTADTHVATSSVCKANPGRHHHRGEGGAEEDFYKTCFSEFSPGCQFFLPGGQFFQSKRTTYQLFLVGNGKGEAWRHCALLDQTLRDIFIGSVWSWWQSGSWGLWRWWWRWGHHWLRHWVGDLIGSVWIYICKLLQAV